MMGSKLILVLLGAPSGRVALLGAACHRLPPLGAAGRGWAPLGTTWHICTNFATCSWEPPTMLNPHFVAGEHGLFGAHESEDIRTIFFKNSGTA